MGEGLENTVVNVATVLENMTVRTVIWLILQSSTNKKN
jgi:hypothetical protein